MLSPATRLSQRQAALQRQLDTWRTDSPSNGASRKKAPYFNGRSPGSDLLEVRKRTILKWPYEFWGYSLKHRPNYHRPNIYGIGTSNVEIGSMAIDLLPILQRSHQSTMLERYKQSMVGFILGIYHVMKS